jgi:hypothetical protein
MVIKKQRRRAGRYATKSTESKFFMKDKKNSVDMEEKSPM